MVDLSGFPALDVIIGLAFIYFLLSIVTSALTEAASGVCQIRFKTMQRGLRELMVSGDVDKEELLTIRRALEVVPGSYDKALQIADEGGVLSVVDKARLDELHETDDSPGNEQSKAELQKVLESNQFSIWDRFESNPRFQALWKQTGALSKVPFFGPRGPSYIPPRVFSLTLLDTLAPPGDAADSQDVVRQAQEAATVPNPLLQKWLQDALAEGGKERDAVLASLEKQFDAVMNRVSGWYKRWSTIWVVVFAVLVAVGMNADSYAIGQRLWKDPAVRSVVVSQAGGGSTTTVCTRATNGTGTKATLDQTAKCVTAIESLGLPFGWNRANRPDFTWAGVFSKAFGLVVTVFALMLGAPFWFDTLSKLARLKTTGKPEGTAAK